MMIVLLLLGVAILSLCLKFGVKVISDAACNSELLTILLIIFV